MTGQILRPAFAAAAFLWLAASAHARTVIVPDWAYEPDKTNLGSFYDGAVTRKKNADDAPAVSAGGFPSVGAASREEFRLSRGEFLAKTERTAGVTAAHIPPPAAGTGAEDNVLAGGVLGALTYAVNPLLGAAMLLTAFGFGAGKD